MSRLGGTSVKTSGSVIYEYRIREFSFWIGLSRPWHDSVVLQEIVYILRSGG